MGKYSHVVESLPKLVATKSEYDNEKYQARVDAEKIRILETVPQEPIDLAEKYKSLRLQKDKIEEDLSQKNLEIEAVAQLLRDSYTSRGVTRIDLDSGGNVNIQLEPQAVVKNRELYRDWCVANGYLPQMQLP